MSFPNFNCTSWQVCVFSLNFVIKWRNQYPRTNYRVLYPKRDIKSCLGDWSQPVESKNDCNSWNGDVQVIWSYLPCVIFFYFGVNFIAKTSACNPQCETLILHTVSWQLLYLKNSLFVILLTMISHKNVFPCQSSRYKNSIEQNTM